MTIEEQILEEIDKGREGLNHGISIGMPRLEELMDGNTKSTYTLVMSNSGSGKTSFVLYSYVYRALMEHLNDEDYKCLYISLEMNEVSLYIKLLSIYIFETYGIQLSYKEILSRKKEYILSEEHYELVKSCMPWVTLIKRHLEIYDKKASAKTVYAILKQRLEKIGNFVETDTRLIYIPNNPNLVYNIVIDHVGLISPSEGRKLKEEIDILSTYLVTLREKCGISPVVIQQANREQGNIERFKAGKSAFNINDTKDSGNPTQDCNVMIAIYNPNRDGLKSYHNYNIEILGNCFRSIMVLKNRFGDCDAEVGCNFFGNICYFKELPKPNDIYDYYKYTDSSYLTKDSINKDDTKEEIKKDVNLNFVL